MKQLENKIKLYIENNGPISFDRFMDFALYDEDYGYYTRNIKDIGKSGDFYTSPSVHYAFGNILSNFIVKGFGYIDSSELSVIELGSGSGYLALDILNNLKETYRNIYDKTTYYCIEKSDKHIELSQKILTHHQNSVKFRKNISDIDSAVKGFILSNEFFDSIPFHRIKFINNNPLEILVATRNNKFVEVFHEIKDSSLLNLINNIACEFIEGQQIEVNCRYENIIKSISEVLASGFFLTFDYGYLQKELYNPVRFNGTYRCYFEHGISENPYINIGLQDITCSVDFSSIIKQSNNNEFKVIKYVTQGQFLVDWGIIRIIEQSLEHERAKIKNLILPETMGNKFKALVQVKNIKSHENDIYPESSFKISYQSINDRIDY